MEVAPPPPNMDVDFYHWLIIVCHIFTFNGRKTIIFLFIINTNYLVFNYWLVFPN